VKPDRKDLQGLKVKPDPQGRKVKLAPLVRKGLKEFKVKAGPRVNKDR
jgi:hypothetical protein